VERVAAAKPPHRQPGSAQGTVHLHCLQRVGAAGRVETAGRRQQRTDKAAITADRLNQHPGGGRPPARCLLIACSRHRHSALSCRRRSAAITRSSSAARSSWRAVAARGLARNTSRLPPGSDRRYARARCLRRRRTLLRTTAGPTRRLTMKPTLAGSSPDRTSRCPETRGLPARLPSWTTASNSARRRILAAAGSIGRHHPGQSSQGQSDADAGAALPPPGRQHRAAGPGAHAQPEAMRLGTTTIVRLERALTHRDSRASFKGNAADLGHPASQESQALRPCVTRAGLPGQQTVRAPGGGGQTGPAAGQFRSAAASYRLAIRAACRSPYDPHRFPTRRERQP
jgi:hypothetical protein